MSNVAKLLLEQEAVILSPQKPFTFASGIRSPIYCDNRILLTDPDVRKEVIKGYLEIAKSFSFDVVGGVATAGIAWGAWIADALEKPFVYVRSAAKEHGKKNQVEGRMKENSRILLVEDLISTGGSVLTVAHAVEESKGNVAGIVAIFSYGFDEAQENFKKKGYGVKSIVTFEDLITTASQLQKLSTSDETLIRSWRADPRKF